NGISIETSPDIRIPLTAVTMLSADRYFNKVDRLELALAGRLRHGVTIGRAQAECDSIWRAVTRVEAELSPGSRSSELNSRLELQPMERGVSSLRTQFSNALVFLMAAAGLLLLMVCAN